MPQRASDDEARLETAIWESTGRGLVPMIVVFSVGMLLMAAPYPWRGELGTSYVYYVLAVVGLMLLVVGALGVRSIVRIFRIYRGRPQPGAETRSTRSSSD